VDDPDYPFESSLKVNASNYLETGFYYCTDEENANLSDESRIAKIYVYVDGGNKKRSAVIILFADSILQVTST